MVYVAWSPYSCVLVALHRDIIGRTQVIDAHCCLRQRDALLIASLGLLVSYMATGYL